MDEKQSFENFFDSISLDSLSEYQSSIESLTKLLNKKYYGSDSVDDHCLVVGSVGRQTAVSETSDLDLLFVLPQEVYTRFNAYDSNGQSALLQEVKKTIKSRYPRTDIKGDGQAVVINFTDRFYSIDLVPAFEQEDGSFKYPDSNDGGSWKKTDPIPEQDACSVLFERTDGDGKRLCNALRVWKNTLGFHFKGLLIDTLVNSFYNQKDRSSDPYDLLSDLFKFLSEQDREQSFWHALGSNQQVTNDDNGAFVPKAKKAHGKLIDATSSDDKEQVLIDLFGKSFSEAVVDGSSDSEEAQFASKYGVAIDERFVEDQFKVDIRRSMEIDCQVIQHGFRPSLLRDMLSSHCPLLRKRSLHFFVVNAASFRDCDFYWKVRNRGEAAFQRNCIRGEIQRGNKDGFHDERTDFVGPHYVECYAVRNSVCIARSRIEVPIS